MNFTEKPKYITLANVEQHQNDKAEVDKAYELGLTPEQPELEKTKIWSSQTIKTTTEQEQKDIDKTIILEALSKKRQANNSKAIGSYLEELEKTTRWSSQTIKTTTEQEQKDIDKTIMLEALSKKKTSKQ